MILPLPRGDHLRATAWPTWKAPETLVCSSRCHLLLGKILERRAVLDAGIVDQDVDRADLGLDAGHCSLDRVPVGDVEGRDVDACGRQPAARPRPHRAGRPSGR